MDPTYTQRKELAYTVQSGSTNIHRCGTEMHYILRAEIVLKKK